MRGTVHSQEPHGSYYSPVFLYASGKPLPKRGKNIGTARGLPRRTTGHVIRDPIMGKGNLGTEADLIYAGPCARAKSPPLRRAPRSNSRDPIRGHGDLGEEHDPFQRTAKVRRVNGTHQSRAVPISERDPVRCTGDLGPELDHLNRSPKVNRKAGKARPSQDPHRDPILGQGAIECYDKFRHGPERSRSSPRSQQARRDPIKGEGDIEEFDAITNGPLRVRLSRAPKPDTARGRASRDVPDSVSTLHSSNGRTPSSNRVHRDPIKGLGDFSTETKVRGRKQGGPRPSSGEYSIRDPISGRNDDRPTFLYDKITPRPATSRPATSRPGSASTRSKSMDKFYRNPISGEGIAPPTISQKRSKSVPPYIGRNPISGSTDIENQPPCGQHHKRHAGRATDSNPILGSGEDLKTYDITRESKARTPRPKSEIVTQSCIY